jgi:trehalose-6-phosphatase
VADINEQQNVQVTALQRLDQSLSSLVANPTNKVAIITGTTHIVR